MRASLCNDLEKRFLIAIMAAGLAVRLAVAWQPIAVLITKNLPDDAFYYFLLAHNAVAVGQVSVDGLNVTNGFHPLWWLLLLPLFGGAAVLGDLPIHLALTAASVIDLVSICGVALIATQLTKQAKFGLVAAFLYAFNPVVILQVTNGLETSLAIATLVAFWWVLIRVIAEPGNRRLTLALGLAAGLAFLVRSDSAIYLALALLPVAYRNRRLADGRPWLAAGALAAAMALPWFVWSKLAVGTWFQESGVAVPYAIRERVRLQHGDDLLVLIQETWRQLTVPNFWWRGDASGLPLIIGLGLWFAVGVGLLIRWRRSRSGPEMFAIVPLLAGGVVLLLIHAGVRWYPRVWYFTPLAAVFGVCAALCAETFAAGGRRLFVAIAGFMAYYLAAGFILWFVGLYPWQRHMLAASAWLSQHTDPASTVGSFNSGIYAYYSQRRTVNLDGVVNHAALEAVRQRAILPYLQETGIEFLVDTDWAIHTEYALFMGAGYPEALQEVAIIDGSADSPFGWLRVYRVQTPP